VFYLLIKVLTINGEIISVIYFVSLLVEGLVDLKLVAVLNSQIPRWVVWLVEEHSDTVCSES
jgi:hypothetical protein